MKTKLILLRCPKKSNVICLSDDILTANDLLNWNDSIIISGDYNIMYADQQFIKSENLIKSIMYQICHITFIIIIMKNG